MGAQGDRGRDGRGETVEHDIEEAEACVRSFRRILDKGDNENQMQAESPTYRYMGCIYQGSVCLLVLQH